MGFPGGSEVKSLPSMWETRVRYLGQEDPLEKEIAIHSSILGKSHGWRSLADYSPWGSAKSRTGLSNFTFAFNDGT